MDKAKEDQFKKSHIVHFLDEAIEVIKDKYPDYYPSAKSFFQKKWANFCNIFIMKKEDFIKWGDFVYGVMYEVDKKNNLNTDADVKKLITKEINTCRGRKNIDYQAKEKYYFIYTLKLFWPWDFINSKTSRFPSKVEIYHYAHYAIYFNFSQNNNKTKYHHKKYLIILRINKILNKL